MAKKFKPDQRGFVFSTDPDFRFEEETNEDQETVIPAQQKLKVRLETKHRAGKMVTLVEGFKGTNEDAAALGKELKSFCGTGGSVKEKEIIIQGDQRDKTLNYLLKKGYSATRKM
jgi:translation initiation factor 1